MAITLTPSELRILWMQIGPHTCICYDCPPEVHRACRLLAGEIFSGHLKKRRIKQACQEWRDYTDNTCDTYNCPNCPNYSWCTTLRRIAVEGVKIDKD